MKLYLTNIDFGWMNTDFAEVWRPGRRGKLGTLFFTRRKRWVLVLNNEVKEINHEDALDWFADNRFSFESTMNFEPPLPQLATGEL